ncbi:hypothetical protein [Kistimonas asteriae]|uniref:hypothetical protein n=1 Tax=Kistimonas asteriae TaxID=517724 RepID=UPI001BADA7AA|nr:hypothetical protein [Kistimonas asteriae]
MNKCVCCEFSSANKASFTIHVREVHLSCDEPSYGVFKGRVIGALQYPANADQINSLKKAVGKIRQYEIELSNPPAWHSRACEILQIICNPPTAATANVLPQL